MWIFCRNGCKYCRGNHCAKQLAINAFPENCHYFIHFGKKMPQRFAYLNYFLYLCVGKCGVFFSHNARYVRAHMYNQYQMNLKKHSQ